MGRRERRKGANYERYIANLFQQMGFEEAKRHLETQAQEAEAGRDLDGTQPWAVQAKHWSKTPSISALLQIKPDEEYPLPVAILKRTQSKGIPGMEVAVLPLPVFLAMIDIIENALAYRGVDQHVYKALKLAYEVGFDAYMADEEGLQDALHEEGYNAHRD